jgi:iron complex outermembrane receptor protein
LFYELPGALTKAEFEADPTQAKPGNDADEASGDYVNADLSFAFNPSDRAVIDGNAGYRFRLIRTDFVSFSSYTDLNLQNAALTPKLKLEQPVFAGNRLVVGIDGFFDQADLDSYSDITRIASTLKTRIRKATLGTYIADDLQILPVLTASAGVRYELAQISAKTLKTSGTPINDEKLHHALVYDIGIQLELAPYTKLWAGYGTVFRYPFVDEQVSMYGFGSDAFYADLDPERGYNIETGLEVVLAPWLRWVASGYLLDMTDEIAVVETAPFVYENVNQDKTRHLGAEMEIALSVPNRAEFSANYAFASATFQAGTDKGNTIPLVPAHQAGADLAIHLPLDITAGLSGQYVSEQFTGGDTANALDKIDAYFLMDAFVRYQPEYVPGDLDLYFGVNNLLNVMYATTGYSGTYYPGEGRNWKLGASYNY